MGLGLLPGRDPSRLSAVRLFIVDSADGTERYGGRPLFNSAEPASLVRRRLAAEGGG